jgi:hypothetical protein
MCMRVPLITEFYHTLSTDVRKGTCTTEVVFLFMYRGIIQSYCAQIPVARATILYGDP